LDLADALNAIGQNCGRPCVVCGADPRLVIDKSSVRLSARELTDEPLVEHRIGDREKHVTHLPVHTLRAAAASLPAGDWGPKGQEEAIETIGWVHVTLPGQQLNSRMFVARIEGESMDDGRSGLVDGGHAVFEFWPSGPRQGLNVLVRGSFSDPETGSYAVKRYDAETRDVERQRERIVLRSLNPDRTRFPDIELSNDREDSLTVVAKVVCPLASGEMARKPKPLRKPGRRDLAATNEISEKLEAFGSRFFDSIPRGAEPDPKEAQQIWTSEIVCLDAEAGGPHIEVGPLVGLWSFVKRLRVQGQNWQETVLASNTRQRAMRIPIPLGAGPWVWTAVDHEDDQDIDLSRLALAALDVDSTHVFRVDAAGVGRRLTGTVLSLGQHYRLLSSNSVWKAAGEPTASPIPGSDGWHLWELDLAEPVPAGLPDLLGRLGLQLGEGTVRLEWVLVPPVRWNITPKGESYPSFMFGSQPVISVTGPEVDTEGAARLYLRGESDTWVFSLPKGPEALVQVSELAPGRYTAGVLYDRTSVPTAYAPFDVLSELPPIVAAEWRFVVNGYARSFTPGAPLRLSASDLSSVEQAAVSGVKGPPGWPLRISWREVAEDVLCTLNADTDGCLDESRIQSAVLERTRRRPVGDLILDAGELGQAVLPHHHRPTPDVVRSAVKDLTSSLGETVLRLAGQYEVLLPRWFEPVCALLGYEVEPVAFEPDGAPGHYRVCTLYRVERRGPTFTRRPRRLLVLTESVEQAPAGLRDWLDAICADHGLHEVLLADGLHWTLHRSDSRMPLKVWDVAAVSTDETEFMAFLRDAAVGV
jgi:hypothetical protein